MSAPGTLSNYYVDSFLVPEGDELAAPRYAPPPLGPPPPPPPPPRPAALGEHPELAPCSFQPKAPVFGPPWSPAHPGGASGVPAVYHPYAHHQAPVAPPDGRYMRSWLEPVPGSLSFPGLPTSRHYGIKPEPLAARRGISKATKAHSLKAMEKVRQTERNPRSIQVSGTAKGNGLHSGRRAGRGEVSRCRG
ncbi:Homeobox protein Hox-A9 [Aix galericulata]|nr:Homeobox protein Hox-A9 [Aix galericulata]